jgi:hypothetical protein
MAYEFRRFESFGFAKGFSKNNRNGLDYRHACTQCLGC